MVPSLFNISPAQSIAAENLAQDVLARVAAGKAITDLIDLETFPMTLSEQERYFVLFDHGLRAVLMTSREKHDLVHDTVRHALGRILDDPGSFSVDRFRQCIFRRLADHTSMCLHGCGVMSFDAQHTARQFVASFHIPEVQIAA